jgi:hypothetical protein
MRQPPLLPPGKAWFAAGKAQWTLVQMTEMLMAAIKL